MAGILEQPNEYLRIYDPATNGIIYCVNRLHLRTPGWSKQWLLSDTIPAIDVTSVIPFESKQAFTFDSYVDQKHIPKFVDMLIDFACLIHYHLVRSGSVIVHCKNGRSRSPTVILGFMMLRGLTREHATKWLQLAFQSQRPTIASKSGQFPNFTKFTNLQMALEMRCFLHSEKVKQRVFFNLNTFFSSSSLSSSNTSTSLLSPLTIETDTTLIVINAQTMFNEGIHLRLFGSPWKGIWKKPRSLQGVLPFTSFCSAIGTTLHSSLLPSNNNENVRGRSSDRLQNKRSSPRTFKPDPNTNVMGRRVKVPIVAKKKRQREQLMNTQEYKYGTLVEQLDSKRWRIDFDNNKNGKTEIIESEIIESAFIKGSRVTINWENAGQLSDGVVSEWDGGLSYKIWFDQERKIFLTPGQELFSSSKPLPSNCPNWMKTKTKTTAERSSSSSSSLTQNLKRIKRSPTQVQVKKVNSISTVQRSQSKIEKELIPTNTDPSPTVAPIVSVWQKLIDDVEHLDNNYSTIHTRMHHLQMFEYYFYRFQYRYMNSSEQYKR